MTGSEKVLIEDWCQQYPSHSVGSVVFGRDGALYVSGGEGASFRFTDYGQEGDPVNPCGDPPGGRGATLTPPTAEGGALRSQDLRTTGDPVGLGGKVLRVDAATGAALSDNPLYSSADPNARRIIASGLRNPFRIAVRPDTDEVWVGDVGQNKFEEIDRINNPTDSTVDNFGWPCYEGNERQPGFDDADLNICEDLYTANAVTSPLLRYHHGSTVVAGESCPAGTGSSTSGLAFYGGGPYPDAYDGALFFADYSRNCIWAMHKGSNGAPDPTALETFVAGAAAPVNLQIGPNGDLFYADLTGGTIRRIEYSSATSDTTPPTVSSVAPADEATGVAPSDNVETTFSEDMAASTLTTTSFTLTEQGGNTPVAAAVSYDSATDKATLNPNADLKADTTYTATVEGGSGGVTDVAGNALAQDKVWSFTTAPAQNEEVVLVASGDTKLQESTPNKIYSLAVTTGADGSFPDSGKDKSALIKWDLSEIAPGTKVNSATVTLTVEESSPETFEAYKLKQPWTEAAATWTNYATGKPWQVGGAKGSLDREATASGSITPSSLGAQTFTLDAAVIQDWVDNPANNQGIIILDEINPNGFDFYTRNSTTVSQRPQLTLDLGTATN
jgi:glucose/arabinose dehydrogenase